MRAVDLFAGAGGTTLGATWAGARVLTAVNHWPIAVQTHAAAHPETEHRCEDAAILDPTTLPAHDLLLASPSCTGHTRARGTDQPHHDAAGMISPEHLRGLMHAERLREEVSRG